MRDETDDDVLPAPGANINQPQMPGDRGDGDDDTEWQLVMAGATRGAARALSQTQEAEQQPTDQRQI